MRDILSYILVYYKWKKFPNRLKHFNQIVCFSPYHQKWYKKFNNKIFYFPAPVHESKIKVTKKLILEKINYEKKKLLFMSKNLSGTASINGLKNLLNLVDNELQIFLKKKNIKIEICGLNFPKGLKNKFLNRSIYIYNEPIELDLVHKDYYLHLNTVDQKLGARTRIISCFSYGIPSISHYNSRLGIPFIRYKNSGALLYTKKETFKKLLMNIINDDRLYTVNCLKGYEIYRQNFLPKKFIDNISMFKTD